MQFLSITLLLWSVTLIDLHMTNHPCFPGISPTWLGYLILLMCCELGFCLYVVEDFRVYVHQRY